MFNPINIEKFLSITYTLSLDGVEIPVQMYYIEWAKWFFDRMHERDLAKCVIFQLQYLELQL